MSHGISSPILGIIMPGKSTLVNLVLEGSLAIAEKPAGDQNVEAVSFSIDLIVLGRDCGIAPSRM
jgi:hypothetical protein